ncbi:diiron oxygenase [Streptomyces sp.]|uniref:diiron oxygenase n=1 Tax=Streptomyces sp. TaxID=1931 RepID=UPI002F3E3102
MTTPLTELKVLDSWHEKSGVRAGERRVLEEDTDILKDFFPEHLVPHLTHPLVRDSAPDVRRFLGAQHLHQWLRFTSHFEVAVVNRATQRIAEGGIGFDVPDRARIDAFKIYVDEGYHSLYSLDVSVQIEERSAIRALPYDFTPFISQLDDVGSGFPQHRKLVQLLQVVVFETLITSILADVPRAENVITLVRDTVRDHVIDEGRHHAFFSKFFEYVWGQLAPAERRLMATFLPSLIVRSLQPATGPAHQALRVAGFDRDARHAIVEDAYRRESVLESIRFASAKTVALFEQHGVLELPGVRDQFTAEGLLSS